MLERIVFRLDVFSHLYLGDVELRLIIIFIGKGTLLGHFLGKFSFLGRLLLLLNIHTSSKWSLCNTTKVGIIVG